MKKWESNAARQPGRTEIVPTELELAALDDLGPLTRSAIQNAPLGTLAYSIVSQVVDLNEKIEAENVERAARDVPLRPYLDPRDPNLDARLAQGVVGYNYQLLISDNVDPDAARSGVVPLRSQPSPRSVREQRRAMRGARRWR